MSHNKTSCNHVNACSPVLLDLVDLVACAPVFNLHSYSRPGPASQVPQASTTVVGDAQRHSAWAQDLSFGSSELCKSMPQIGAVASLPLKPRSCFYVCAMHSWYDLKLACDGVVVVDSPPWTLKRSSGHIPTDPNIVLPHGMVKFASQRQFSTILLR